jgi:flagellar biosynthesis chaperone FliJ
LKEVKMTTDTIQKIQACLTVRQNGTSKKILDVETLLRRHGHDQVLSLLLDLLKEKQKKLVRLMEGDRSKKEIDETVAQTFRLHMAIKVIEREMEEVK